MIRGVLLRGSVFRREWLTVASALVVAVAFLVSHFPLWLEFPIPTFKPDWGSYYQVLRGLIGHYIPDLSDRPPTFPAFLAVFLPLVGGYQQLLILQGLMAMVALVYAVYVASRIDRWFGVATGLILAGYALRGRVVEIDSWVLTEPLYRTLAITGIALLVHGIVRRSWRLIAAGGVVGAAIVGTKPAGLWIMVSLVLAAIALWATLEGTARARTARAAGALVPAILLLFVWSTYNRVTAGTWSLSSNGALNFAAGTWYYWETSEKLPDELNGLIRTVKRRGFNCHAHPKDCIEGRHLDKFINSSHPKKIWRAHKNMFGWQKALAGFGAGEYAASRFSAERWRPPIPAYGWEEGAEKRFAGRLLKPIIRHAVREHPDMFLKKTLANFYVFNTRFFSDAWGGGLRLDYALMQGAAYARNRTVVEEGRQVGECRPELGVYRIVGPFCGEFPDARLGKRVERYVSGEEIPFFAGLYNAIYSRIYEPIFERKWLGLMFLVTMTVALGRIIITRGREITAWVGVLISSAAFGAGALVSLSAVAAWKYAEPTMVFNFWSIAALALFLPVSVRYPGLRGVRWRGVSAREANYAPGAMPMPKRGKQKAIRNGLRQRLIYLMSVVRHKG